MAAANKNLLDEAFTSWYNSAASALTGKPTPGSNEAIQAEITKATLQRELNDLKKNPNDPQAQQQFMSRARQLQDLQLRGAAAQQALNMQSLGAPTLLDARTRLTDESIRQGQAATQNEINLFDTKSQRQRDILADITGQELKLADRDAATVDKVLSYYSSAQDKNLAAQAEARRPNFGNIAGLLGSLGLAAASLFG